jgi:hypothetical protein
MDRSRRLLALALVALAALVVALVDPLEGFPLALIGGVLALIDAHLARSRWLIPLGWGLALAAAGCAAMLVLTALGGIGGASGRSLAWGVIVLPYPVGALTLLVGTLLLVRQLWRSATPAP